MNANINNPKHAPLGSSPVFLPFVSWMGWEKVHPYKVRQFIFLRHNVYRHATTGIALRNGGKHMGTKPDAGLHSEWINLTDWLMPVIVRSGISIVKLL